MMEVEIIQVMCAYHQWNGSLWNQLGSEIYREAYGDGFGCSVSLSANRMAICMGAILLVLALITWLRPLKEPVELPVNDAISLEGSRDAKWAEWGVVLATIALYIIFW